MCCNPEMIINEKHFNISQCTECRRIGLYYKNLLVGFKPREFASFSRLFNQIDFEMAAIRFPDGHDHIVVNTCHPDIQFSFTKAEFEEFREMLQHASLILKANRILRTK
ncbi:hypothetical protein QQ020_12610 [Fulvivirgaceae bacterium BMA12]|uniref:Uncharacterized protein n=1 Tax=Agaribacillus aureus TaxID=3051825 RepID=A0ABT8L586_9BACT|nr:hypothetical protein [Fulvivirgaceae bacterium BMA12]